MKASFSIVLVVIAAVVVVGCSGGDNPTGPNLRVTQAQLPSNPPGPLAGVETQDGTTTVTTDIGQTLKAGKTGSTLLNGGDDSGNDCTDAQQAGVATAGPLHSSCSPANDVTL